MSRPDKINLKFSEAISREPEECPAPSIADKDHVCLGIVGGAHLGTEGYLVPVRGIILRSARNFNFFYTLAGPPELYMGYAGGADG